MTDMQDGLFDNPPPPILCEHANCRKEVAYRSVGDLGRWRWIHVRTNQSQCDSSGTQWARPAKDTMCERCGKPMPRSYCWDGCRIMGQCPLGFMARDIAEGEAAPTVVISEAEERRLRMNAELTEGPSEAVLQRRAAQAHARRSDPTTSHEAAASITSDKLRRSQLGVIAMFQRFGPMHDQLLVERYMQHGEGLVEQSESGIRTRRRELVDKRVLEDSGEKVVLDSGRKSIVWRLWSPR